MTELSIIIVTYNSSGTIRRCLKSIKKSEDDIRKEIIIIDNASSDDTIDVIKKTGLKLKLIENKKNIGFAKACNQAYKYTTSKDILLLNPDAFIGKHTISKTINYMESHKKCAILGCTMKESDGTLHPSIRKFPTPWKIVCSKMGFGHTRKNNYLFNGIKEFKCNDKKIQETDWVIGSFLLCKKKIVDQEPFFLRPEFFMYKEDVDICLRLKRKGYNIIYYPEKIIHLGGVSSKDSNGWSDKQKQIKKYQIQSDIIYFRKNYNLLYLLYYIFMILSINLIILIKNALNSKKKLRYEELKDEINLIIKYIFKTRFGKNTAR